MAIKQDNSIEDYSDLVQIVSKTSLLQRQDRDGVSPTNNNEIVVRTLSTRDNSKYHNKFDLSPKEGDTVKIHYEIYLFKTNEDGSLITTEVEDMPLDSSIKRNLPFQFVVGNGDVVEGLDIAVKQMTLGQLVEVSIPHIYAFGDDGFMPQILPKTPLLLHVELLDFTKGDVLKREWK